MSWPSKGISQGKCGTLEGMEPVLLERLVATREETVAALLRRSRRKGDAVPIRRAFLQQRLHRRPQAGPLAMLVKSRDERALDLYLLFHAVASAEPWDVSLPSGVWARSLGLGTSKAAQSAVSKAWARLEKHGLIRRQRRRRLASITLLVEDGSGEPYRHPAGTEPYLKVPYSYWLSDEAWYQTLPLAAKAMLLVALSQPPEFVLPVEKVRTWYGISPGTARRGLRELRNAEVLTARKEFKKAPLAPQGYTAQNVYALRPPFTREFRP